MTKRVGLSQISLAQLNRPTPIKTTEKESLSYYLRYRPYVMANFVFKFFTFRYCVELSTRVGIAKD